MEPRIAPGTRSQLGFVNSLIVGALGRATGGRPPHIFTTLGRHRGLFRRWLFFAGGLMPGGMLPRGDTELVILRVAHNTGCDYEWARAGPGAEGGSERQRMLLRAADELHAEGRIGDELWAGLAAELDEPRL